MEHPAMKPAAPHHLPSVVAAAPIGWLCTPALSEGR